MIEKSCSTSLAFATIAILGQPPRIFQNYKSAILAQKGDVAFDLVTRRTVDEYQRYLNWGLTGDRQTLESLPFINRFQVIMLKHRIPADILKQLDGRTLLVYTVDSDWIRKDGVIRTTLGKVDVADNRATAPGID
jgi:hypothetical protein